jgi:hypothetical protein
MLNRSQVNTFAVTIASILVMGAPAISQELTQTFTAQPQRPTHCGTPRASRYL